MDGGYGKTGLPAELVLTRYFNVADGHVTLLVITHSNPAPAWAWPPRDRCRPVQPPPWSRLAGAGVVATARSNPADAPGRLFAPAGVSTPEGAATIAAYTLDQLGGVDISGVIIHVPPAQWRRPDGTAPAYAAASAALTNYSKGLAREMAPHGIRVLTVTPGFIETSAAQARIEQMADGNGTAAAAARQQLITGIGGIPPGRPGRPEEVAELAAFLASDRASYLTASEYVADGGNIPSI